MGAALQLNTERMIAETEGPIGWITFNNPARHNAVSVAMWEAIPAILDAYEADPAVRVVVLRGAGDRAFVSGADISEFGERRNSPEAVAEYNRISGEAHVRLVKCPKPTIAMIRGYCLGGGTGIAVTCDMRIAADDARFAVPAAKLGLGYAADGVKRLVDVVGPSYAKEIFYTARQFTAAEAQMMGLANRVVPAAELESYVRDYATRIGENAPLTIGAVKITIDELMKEESRRDLGKADAAVDRCFKSADYVEGRTAFMEKRKPQFRGR
jgi:enoyl-CoA hydratase/carnithine racemase